jgi:hypothetical protein
MALLVLSLIGLIGPNGLFIYWMVREYSGIAGVLQDKLAIAFIADAFLALAVLAYHFAKTPIGRLRWYWFVGLSLIGGLGFSVPFYIWLNNRSRS